MNDRTAALPAMFIQPRSLSALVSYNFQNRHALATGLGDLVHRHLRITPRKGIIRERECSASSSATTAMRSSC
jgi:hypothetical protein